MKRKSKGKVIAIVLVIALLLTGGGLGGWYFLQNRNSEPVKVFPFEYIGMTEYWGDSQESYGPVSTDRVQTVFLSDTQSITEILVQPGDTVKKGDVLMTFDTTLDDLALERERLAVEKLKLQLDNAKDELRDIKNMKPMPESTEPPAETEPNRGMALQGDYQISQNKAYDGSSPEKAMILWLRDSASLDDSLLEQLRQTAQGYQQANTPAPAEPIPTEPETTEPETTEPETTEPETTEPVVPPAEETEPTEEPSVDPTEESTGEPTEEPGVDPTEESTGEPSEEPTEEPTEEPSEDPTEEPSEDPTEPSSEFPGEEPTVPSKPADVKNFFLVVKITEGNMSLGYASTWQGMEVSGIDSGFRLKFYDASAMEDHMAPQETVTQPSVPQIDMGSGYTAAQIAQMRSDKEKEIKDLQFQVKMAESKYEIKKTEMGTGEVLAAIDGSVVSLLTEEEARQTMQPILKLSGGGGFYVNGSVSELEKDNLQIGQEVTVNDWNTGMEYTGTVESIGDFPSADGYWNGMGNPNASYYPFRVFIDESANLQAGTYVNVLYSTATTEQGIYLENPFLRTEQGKTYVYVSGADGKLEKRAVTTGKALWGSYTEVLSGITAEDLIAFPYGKTVVPGADTVESDLSELYG